MLHPKISVLMQEVQTRYAHQKEFIQAVEEFLLGINPLLLREPDWLDHALIERLLEPERMLRFRVTWVDDHQKVQVNRAYRVQYNSSLGPYKGGLRFHPSVNSSIIQFLGFEQTFKNALTGLPMGGAKGGADFDPKDKSDAEVMRFCQAMMTEMHRHLGPDLDVPAGDIGVGAREIGYLYGMYKKISNQHTAGVFTGKALSDFGSFVRKEATGYGLVYLVNHLLNDLKQDWASQTLIVSGSGNVALYAIEKAQLFGAKVVACSDSTGTLYDPQGLDLKTLKHIKEVQRSRLSAYVVVHPHARYDDTSQALWTIPCTMALPCATQGEIDHEAAHHLIQNGCKVVAEGANMPTQTQAIQSFHEAGVLYLPGKASNAGGVATSGLEISQNAQRLNWSFDEVDIQLQRIMRSIYVTIKEEAERYGHPMRFDIGANIAGFKRVAQAMKSQGVL